MVDRLNDLEKLWNERTSKGETALPLKTGGGGGIFDPMEARVKRLEDDGREIKADLKKLLSDASEIKGKLSGMPSTWQIIGIVGVMLALVIASAGGAIGLIKYLTP